MELPQQLEALTPRGMDEIAAAAHASQANVVTLRVAWQRRSSNTCGDLEIQTPSPGPVVRMREILLDRLIIKTYELEEIHLRLRQIWGEFTALCWLFPFVDPQQPIRFDDLPPEQTLRCPTELRLKRDEVQKHLWRIRHEQRRRHDPTAPGEPEFQRDNGIAMQYPIKVFGQAIHACRDDVLLCAACEHAGMLAAFRWASDNRWGWEGPGIMDVVLKADDLR